ncbi:MAG: sulfite exporter TauE/SafE family protein [Elusimicrobia bacterium]|nr:sulfite exporter TauE/SafE family protein [Elusimicrobiota bacterium]
MSEAIYPLIFLVALAYASVGHGGASGYLAVLALFGFSPKEMAPSALALNLLVSATAFLAYWRSGFFDRRLFWPFAVASIPAAFLGGMLPVPLGLYSGLLMAALLFAAFRLALASTPLRSEEEMVHPPRLCLALPVGGGIGLLSGMVGVGGGIFLSPVLLLMRWADARRTAAVSACFIWVNSAAGLYGHLSRSGLDVVSLWPLVVAAFFGGLIGSHLGAQRFGEIALRRVLAAVLVVTAFKVSRLAFG